MKQQAFVSEILVDFTTKCYGSGQSDDLRGMVRKLLIDKIGLTIAGAKFPWSEGSYRATTAFPAQGRSTVIYFGDLLSPEQAAFVNASSGNAQDYDDTNIAIKIHAGGVVIPAALAVGESESRSPDQIARALVLGIEVMTRLGAGIPNSHLNGFHTPDVVGPFGAGIATGLLLGLDKAQMMNMMGICGSFSGGVEEYTRSGGTVKRNLPGIAVIAGIRAAYLAKEGITGPLSIIEGDHGICRSFDDGAAVERVTAKLGEEWLVLETSFKKYNCCYAIHAALEAFLFACHDNGVKPEDIESVKVGASKFVCDHVGSIKEPRVLIEAQFSLSFMLAVALCDGPPGEYDVTDETCKRKELVALSKKVTHYVDDVAQRETNDNMGAVVTVRVTSGQEYQKRVRYPKGTSQNPMTEEDLEEKFRANLGPVVSTDRIATLLDTIRNYYALPGIGTLMALTGREGPS